MLDSRFSKQPSEGVAVGTKFTVLNLDAGCQRGLKGEIMRFLNQLCKGVD